MIQCLWIADCKNVVIELGKLYDASDFLLHSAPLDIGNLMPTMYIKATANITDETIDGYTYKRTTLDSGKFEVVEGAFIEQMKDFYALEFRGKEWYADNNATTATWVKQRIQAALMPFGIDLRKRNDLYASLKEYCTKSDLRADPLKIVSADDLNGKLYTRPPYIVDGILYPGLTVVAAPPKTGKSFLALDLACCVAEGKPFWGYNTNQGAALYLDLEGTEWRTQDRFPIVGRKSKQDCPASLAMVYNARKIDDGLIEQLNDWISTAKNPRLIIIDTLAHIKGRVRRSESFYEADTRFMKPLHDLAIEKGFAIMAITHTRKSNGLLLDDPMDAVIGSTAQFGNADAGWIISGRRGESKKCFTAVGRDFEQVELEIERTQGGRWACIGTMQDAQQRDRKAMYEQDATVAFIREHLAKCGGMWTCTAQQIINEAAKSGSPLVLDAIRLSQRLRLIAPQMEQNDNIMVTLPSGGGRDGRKFTFKQI